MLDFNEFTVPIVVASTLSAAAVTNPKLSFPYTVDILGVSLVVGTAPATQGVIVQLVNDGSNAYTSSGTDKRPTVAATATQGSAGAPDLFPTLVAGKVLTATIAQVGSGTAGSDLTINVHLRKK
jgi:hypothetical protein